MTLSKPVAFAIIACSLALGLTGCADNRLDGGYSEGAPPMHVVTRHQVAAAANIPEEAAPEEAPSNEKAASPYVYKGGRDPVTGQAAIRN